MLIASAAMGELQSQLTVSFGKWMSDTVPVSRIRQRQCRVKEVGPESSNHCQPGSSFDPLWGARKEIAVGLSRLR